MYLLGPGWARGWAPLAVFAAPTRRGRPRPLSLHPVTVSLFFCICMYSGIGCKQYTWAVLRHWHLVSECRVKNWNKNTNARVRTVLRSEMLIMRNVSELRSGFCKSACPALGQFYCAVFFPPPASGPTLTARLQLSEPDSHADDVPSAVGPPRPATVHANPARPPPNYSQ